jgi:hypothetical protein
MQPKYYKKFDDVRVLKMKIPSLLLAVLALSTLGACDGSGSATISEVVSPDAEGQPISGGSVSGPETEVLDIDGDGVGNADDDNDGVSDVADTFPLDSSETADTDNDGVGDNIDAFPTDANEQIDSDNDGIGDNADVFPFDATENSDFDADGTGNNADIDDDNDGVPDTTDAFPLNSGETIDTDGDGTGDNADADDDNDGVTDTTDAFPLDSSETTDTDADGIGDNADTVNDNLCVVGVPPANLGLDSFYKKYCDAVGIPFLSSERVSDMALQQSVMQARQMLELRPDLGTTIGQAGIRVAIMATDEVTTDIPEHSDLNEAFPETDWNTRARGLGPTFARPAQSAAEENVLCLNGDRYAGENIFMHEFAHTVDLMGIALQDPTWPARLQATYDAAMASGLWLNTYAATNRHEYFAEGVQSWYNQNLESVPANGIHGEIDTHDELAEYDPALYALIAEFFPKRDIDHCYANNSR